MDAVVLSTGMAALLANIGLGGGMFEHSVVDPAWPKRPEIIQPRRGGISRAKFWIPAHVVLEIALLAALYLGWANADVRFALLLALAAHVIMRLWSAVDMIPKAIAFERADTVDASQARIWTRRSLLRFPLALFTSIATLFAFAIACGVNT